MKKIRDRLWIWGQEAGIHHNQESYHLPGSSRMTPMEGAYYLGVRNCCRVASANRPVPPFDQESMALESLNEVVWSIVGASDCSGNENGWGDLDEVIRQAKMFPNVTGGILDDFLVDRRMAVFSPERLIEMKDRMNRETGRKMDLWLVLYAHDLNKPIQGYLDACDVITYWTWCGSELPRLEEDFKKACDMTPGKRRLAGCYMWDYGEGKPLTNEEMKYQLDIYHKWMKAGLIEGIIFCSNCIADLGLESVEYVRKWIRENGDTTLPL